MDNTVKVSTHSRLKAAGLYVKPNPLFLNSFNTQPPKGGWRVPEDMEEIEELFQHTAA